MSGVRKLATKKTAVQVSFSGCALNYMGYILESIAAVDECIMHMRNRPGGKTTTRTTTVYYNVRHRLHSST